MNGPCTLRRLGMLPLTAALAVGLFAAPAHAVWPSWAVVSAAAVPTGYGTFELSVTCRWLVSATVLHSAPATVRVVGNTANSNSVATVRVMGTGQDAASVDLQLLANDGPASFVVSLLGARGVIKDSRTIQGSPSC